MTSKIQFLCYLGPGTDLVFQSFAGLLAIFAAFFALCVAFVKTLFSRFKKNWKFTLLAVLLLLLIIGALLLPGIQRGDTMRVIVLGIDGFDPDVIERMTSDHRLPNIKNLMDTGSFRRLATTVPPQSPVAWSSFITGADPGKHGVFDFLKRDPSTYLPDLSLTAVEQPKFVSIGGLRIPLGKSRFASCVQGTPLWEITSRAGVPTFFFRCPMTFPPQKVNGKMLSGLGTPDLCGTQGTFSFYVSGKEIDEQATGGRIVKVNVEDRTVTTAIYGPRNADNESATIPLKIRINGDNTVTLSMLGERCTLAVGNWSSWIRLRFSPGYLTAVHGTVKFYLKSVTPGFELYMSPINFDPEKPAFPVSYPGSYAGRLAKEIGLYHTLGQAGDTWALNEGMITDDVALQQYYQVLDEDEKVLFAELNKFRRGLFFFYFGITDTVQHMFFNGPRNDADQVAGIYEQMDRIVGKIMKHVDENTTLIILSDHGFGPFRRVVHLNTWLKENGYLFLKDGQGTSDEFFQDVDWQRTRAYAVGLSGIYVNQRGRERDGIVEPGDESLHLEREIASRLEQLTDPASRQKALHKVARSRDTYTGPYSGSSPDLIVGFNRGWRASWQTALGGVPAAVFEDNHKRWEGDHIFDADLVPGVLITNKRITTGTPRIIDIAPTILKLLAIENPGTMDGTPFL